MCGKNGIIVFFKEDRILTFFPISHKNRDFEN